MNIDKKKNCSKGLGQRSCASQDLGNLRMPGKRLAASLSEGIPLSPTCCYVTDKNLTLSDKANTTDA